MCPEKQQKPVKARVEVLSSGESGRASLFLHRIFVGRVYLSIAATTQDPAGQDPAGQDPHHLFTFLQTEVQRLF